MPASKKIKLAIAGAGMVTRHHLNAWAKLSQVEIVAICARHIENAQARAHEFNIPEAYDDVAQMLDQEEPDALDIATPPQVHAQQVELAAQRAVDVICQKPMRLDLEAAYQKSYDNAIAHFVECLESGEAFETDRLDNLKTLQLVSDAYDLAGL
jgi:predicted dehydrogenase